MSTLRAVRRLKPDPIPGDVLHRVLEAASWAPTGGNAQPWRVIVVRDRVKMARLGDLYAASWRAYVEGHEKRLGEAPEAVRVAT
ncbi:MAG: nitroreductase family protein, partial [Deltaproteobacteria bacterium]|nr:nitroreductase family protein [Deltaproteobacteria bacterium]